MKRLRRCMHRHYGLDDACRICGEPALFAHPPKYSPHDKFAAYRRKQNHG